MFARHFIRAALVTLAILPMQSAFAQGAASGSERISTKVDEYIQAAAAHDRFSGSVLVARDGVPIVSRGYGMANVELAVPNTPDTVFRLGSTTKQFTAMAMLQLQESDKLKVDDPICGYLDNCPAAWKPITIRHLLTHTSGIVNFTSMDGWDEKNSFLPHTRQSLFNLFRDLPLQFVPGEKTRYSNSGYHLLGMIIERASGTTFEEFLRKNILEPLGMKDSGIADGSTLVPGRAEGYDWLAGAFVLPAYENVNTLWAGGGMYSTTADMLRWDQALYTEKLVSKKSISEIFTPLSNGYGLGWQIGKKFGRDEMHHAGSVSGYSAFIYRFPADRVTVVVLSNSDRTSATKAATNLAAIVFGEDYKLPRRQVSELLVATFLESGAEAAINQYRELARSRPAEYEFKDEESTLNRLAYNLLGRGRVTDAIAMFELNVERFPKSANRLDSLADGYLAAGKTELAINALQRSVLLDPLGEYAPGKLQELRENL